MIEIRYLQAESGANKFGTCNCCGKSSGEDPLMISIKFSYYGHGTLICLCDDCRKKLIEVLNGEQLPPANNSEMPNSSDAISRQAAIDALNNIEIPRNASWYQYYQQALTAVDKLPPAQPERIRGRWTRDNACSECGCQPWFSGDIHNYSFCPNCGADMREVTT